MGVKIISLGFATPENYYSQAEIFDSLHYPRHYRGLFTDVVGIDKRHFWVPLERLWKLSFQEQQDEYRKGSIEISKQAIANCLDGRSPKDIGCLAFCSCTGFSPGPTIAHYLAKEMGLSPRVYITNILSQGCESGFPGLRRAMDFTLATGKPSLVVACELCSLTYYPEPDGVPDPENDFECLRANAIFSDAAVAMLVGFDNDPRHPVIVDTETYTDTDYLNDLGYTWRYGRLRVLLSRRVPKLAPLVVKPAVDAVLERNNLTIDDIKWFVIHAAGNNVIDNIRDALGIAEEKTSLSRETLRQFGNTSSTSVGITGKRLMSQDIKPGDYVAMLSVGPGLSGGCSLLQFPISESAVLRPCTRVLELAAV